jgi:hypothetical protein
LKKINDGHSIGPKANAEEESLEIRTIRSVSERTIVIRDDEVDDDFDDFILETFRAFKLSCKITT